MILMGNVQTTRDYKQVPNSSQIAVINALSVCLKRGSQRGKNSHSSEWAAVLTQVHE